MGQKYIIKWNTFVQRIVTCLATVVLEKFGVPFADVHIRSYGSLVT